MLTDCSLVADSITKKQIFIMESLVADSITKKQTFLKQLTRKDYRLKILFPKGPFKHKKLI